METDSGLRKIGLIVPGFSADERDWCIPAHTDLVRALTRSHDVQVFALRYPHRVDTYPLGGATVHSLNGVDSHSTASLALWWRALAALGREHRRRPFDVVHSIFGSEAGWVAVLAGKWLHVPSVVWLVNGELVSLPEIGYGAGLIGRQRLLNRLILRYADSILCGCTALTEAARARVPATRRMRIETLPLGVNTARFVRAVERVDEPPHFVNVGSLLPVKDQVTLLEAFRRLRAGVPPARLTIAGSGPLAESLRRRVGELDLGASVTLAGEVPHDQLPALYQSAAVFVQSSRHEGQGMALLEAAACGCAVCGTNVGALRDLAARQAALACAPAEPAALAGVMQQALADRAPLAARGGEIVEREYSLPSICARLSALYARLHLSRETYGDTDIVAA